MDADRTVGFASSLGVLVSKVVLLNHRIRSVGVSSLRLFIGISVHVGSSTPSRYPMSLKSVKWYDFGGAIFIVYTCIQRNTADELLAQEVETKPSLHCVLTLFLFLQQHSE